MAGQMMSRVCLLLALMLHNSAGSLRMDVSPMDVLSGLTRSLTLNCSFSFVEVTNISGIISLNVAKSNNNEQFADLVTLNAFTPDDVTTLAQVDGKVSGRIDPEHESYLSIVLPFPKDNDTGLYRCEMHGMDNHGHPSQLFQTSMVTLNEPSVDQITKEVSQLQHEFRFLDNLVKNQSDQISECESQLKLEENLAKNQSKEITDMEKKIISLNLINKALRDDAISISREYNGHYYLISKQDSTDATLATQTCQDFGGILAQINDDGEYQFVKDFVSQYSGIDGVLVSGTDVEHEGRWTFTGTNTDLVFYNWEQGQPDGSTRQNCIVMWKDDSWLIVDIECTLSNYPNIKLLCELNTL